VINADHDDIKVTLICGGGGAASEVDCLFDAILKLGQAVTRIIASVFCTLDHFHVPGRSEYCVIPPKTVDIVLGLHNEPTSNYFDHFTYICLNNPIFKEFGSLTLNLHRSSSELIERLLKLILGMDDSERTFVPFTLSDEYV
jgi:dihydroxyacetone kinase